MAALKSIKRRLFWYNKIKPNLKYFAILAAGILISALIIIGSKIFRKSAYSYIDLNGNKGIASFCEKDCGKLICHEYYSNGVLEVKQFVKIR